MMKRVLIVGRGLLGTFLASRLAHDITLCSHEEWQHLWECDNFDVVINCAAIVGQGKCEKAGYDAVMKANVYLPEAICHAVWTRDKYAILFSTEGVYRERLCSRERTPENAPLAAPNLYVASKILMEAQCNRSSLNRSVIFRLGRLHLSTEHPNDFLNIIGKWKFVADRHQALLTPPRLLSALEFCIANKTKGLYNLADRDIIDLPAFVNKHGHQEFEIQSNLSPSMTPCQRMDIKKAEAAGMFGVS